MRSLARKNDGRLMFRVNKWFILLFEQPNVLLQNVKFGNLFDCMDLLCSYNKTDVIFHGGRYFVFPHARTWTKKPINYDNIQYIQIHYQLPVSVGKSRIYSMKLGTPSVEVQGDTYLTSSYHIRISVVDHASCTDSIMGIWGIDRNTLCDLPWLAR